MISGNTVSLRPKYLLRLAFLGQGAIWASVFKRVEDIRYGRALRSHPVPEDPIFIIGHWRTGSTFLHQLMVKDPRFTAPTLFQVVQPDSFLTAYRYYRPIFLSVVSKRRPMDNVRIGMNEPQEDEYAIYRMTKYSPLEKLIFPREKKYFLSGMESYLPPDDLAQEWEDRLVQFFRKISFSTGKRIVSKNPFNSLRIGTLLRLFPGARFIHIIRNPTNVVPSTINMWTIVQRQNCLNRNHHTPTVEEVCGVMGLINSRIREQSQLLSPERFFEIRYEDLERDPIQELGRLYSFLDLPFTPEAEANVQQFLGEVAGYEKNKFNLTGEEQATIRTLTRSYLEQYEINP